MTTESASKPLTAAKVRAVLKAAGFQPHAGRSGYRVFHESGGAFAVCYWPKDNAPADILRSYRDALRAAGIEADVSLMHRCVLCRGYLPHPESEA